MLFNLLLVPLSRYWVESARAKALVQAAQIGRKILIEDRFNSHLAKTKKWVHVLFINFAPRSVYEFIHVAFRAIGLLVAPFFCKL